MLPLGPVLCAAESFDRLYHNLLRALLSDGRPRQDRTGVGTIALFGRAFELDLQRGFPLLGLRQLRFRTVVLETLWTLQGGTNSNWLVERGSRIWQPWAAEDGELGPITGAQWRTWKGPDGERRDQLAALIDGIRRRPHSRRHLLSAWNVADLPDEGCSAQANVAAGRMALAPCLVTQQFYVEGGQLSMMVNQRSADVVVGLPFDVAASALLLHMVARASGLHAYRLVHVVGDLHLYNTHQDHARQMLQRTCRSMPDLVFHVPPRPPHEYQVGDMDVAGYAPHPALPAQAAV